MSRFTKGGAVVLGKLAKGPGVLVAGSLDNQGWNP